MRIIFLLLFVFLNTGILHTKESDDKNSIGKINENYKFAKFNINNTSTFFFNNGITDQNENGNTGFIFPNNVYNKTTWGNGFVRNGLIFRSGILWGAKKGGIIHVGGSTYLQGITGGRILENGIPQDPNDPSVRVYRVRPDYKTSDLTTEINDEQLSYQEIFNQYEKDWNEWPAEFGAPFDDINNNGVYEPSIDIPGVSNADQTLWYVANDLDTLTCKNAFGSDPLNIELQVTIWGYKNSFPQNNILYKKYKFINKSDQDFNEMYISQFADTEVGDAGNDYIGVDTLLNLAYGYNADNYDGYDDWGYGTFSPAIGFQLLQGPIVKGNENNIAIFNGKQKVGFKNLDMASALRLVKNYNTYFDDPCYGEYDCSTLYYYNFMQGLDFLGNNQIDPITNKISKFSVNGDPVTNSGWIESKDNYAPGDRRLILSSGPFTIAPGDTQEVIIAVIAAQGNSNLNSVKILKDYAKINFTNNIKIETPEFIVPEISFSDMGPAHEISFTLNNKDELYNFEHSGYKFQGLNLRIYTQDNLQEINSKNYIYDKIDGIKEISGIISEGNDLLFNQTQYGTDSGIPEKFIFDKDIFENTDIVSGKKYNFGISAYYYNPNSILQMQNSFSKIFSKTIVFDSTQIIYGDTIFYQSIFDNDIGIMINASNPNLLTGHEYKILLKDDINKLSFDLIDNNENKKILENYSLIDTENQFQFSDNIDGCFMQIQPKPYLLAFNAGNNIQEIFHQGEENKPPINLSTNLANYSYGIRINNISRDLSKLIKDINISRSNDYEIRFNIYKNYGIQFFTTKKVVSVPFELWNIGKTPNDKSDDIRMIPFILENEERDNWDFSDSLITFLNYYEYLIPYSVSDQIFWMFPKDKNGYEKFANVCEQSGVGSEYNLTLDTSDQGYFVDFMEDTTYAIGNLNFIYKRQNTNYKEIIPSGTTVRFTSTPNLTGKEIIFTTPERPEYKSNFDFELLQNFPNPFNPITKIQYNIPQEGKVNISIYNVLGQKVAELLNDNVKAGKYELAFNGSNFASGIYIYRIEAKNFIESKKMILLK